MLRFTARQDTGLEKKNTGYGNIDKVYSLGKYSSLYMY
jgi:hypothetical protein